MTRWWVLAAVLWSIAGGAAAQNSGANGAPQKIDSSKVKAPVPLTTPDAEMPDAARRAQTSGICVVSLVVDASGNPQSPRVVRCTDAIFADSSIEAVKKYRFKPAYRISDGTAVPVRIMVEINFSFRGRGKAEPPATIRYSFGSPPGPATTTPDAEGVYPLSKLLEPPQMVEFASKGFAQAALPLSLGTGCDLLLVLDVKGKPQSATVSKCDKAALERPAVESMMKSKFKPAKLNGKAVPVRLRIHLVYEGFSVSEGAGKPS